MQAGQPKQSYSPGRGSRVLGISERQLRSWEKQELVPHLDDFAFTDLIALRSLDKFAPEPGARGAHPASGAGAARDT